MFDMSWGEVMLIGGVALIVIGPKELPRTLRTVGQVTSKLRRMSAEFVAQFNEAMREAELEDVKRDVEGINRSVSSSLNAGFNPIQTIRDELKGSIEAAGTKPSAAPSPAMLADATARLEADRQHADGQHADRRDADPSEGERVAAHGADAHGRAGHEGIPHADTGRAAPSPGTEHPPLGLEAPPLDPAAPVRAGIEAPPHDPVPIPERVPETVAEPLPVPLPATPPVEVVRPGTASAPDAVTAPPAPDRAAS